MKQDGQLYAWVWAAQDVNSLDLGDSPLGKSDICFPS